MEGQKALMLGAGWPQLALDLAAKGIFVTVVDPDESRIKDISRLAGEAKLLGRVTVMQDDYRKRTFEPSAFNLVVAWDTLERYSEIEPMVKKVLRELKAGGRLFVRARITPAQTRPALRRALRSLLPLIAFGERQALAQDSFLLPTHGTVPIEDVLGPIDEHLVIQETIPHHVVAGDVADLAAGVAPALAALLPAVRKLDAQLLERWPDAARFIAVSATKEKQLGRVFRPGL